MDAGVLIVEGAQYSGSAITARMAMEQQREVFAIPGSIMSKMSWGPNLLIKEGAKLVQDWNDVVVELTPADRRTLIAKAQSRQGILPLNGETPDSETHDAEPRTPNDLSVTPRRIANILSPHSPR